MTNKSQKPLQHLDLLKSLITEIKQQRKLLHSKHLWTALNRIASALYLGRHICRGNRVSFEQWVDDNNFDFRSDVANTYLKYFRRTKVKAE